MSKTAKTIWVAAAIAITSICFAFVKRDRPSSASETQIAAFNPYPIGSPARLEQEKFLDWLMGNAQLGRAAASPGLVDRQKLASRLMATGMGRLPDDMLEKYLPLVSKIVESLDVESCGKFMKRELPQAQFVASANAVIGDFNADEANTWFSVEKSAIQADLNGEPVVPIDSEQTPYDLMKFAASLPGNQSAEFLLRLRRFPTASYGEACAVTRTLLSQGSRLNEPYRGRVARLLLTRQAG
ncbi:hypothetical protein [Paraburkholderia xenovorans]